MQTLELILLLLTAVVASSILEKVLPRLSLPLVPSIRRWKAG